MLYKTNKNGIFSYFFVESVFRNMKISRKLTITLTLGFIFQPLKITNFIDLQLQFQDNIDFRSR